MRGREGKVSGSKSASDCHQYQNDLILHQRVVVHGGLTTLARSSWRSHHTHMKLMEVSPHSHVAHGGLTTLARSSWRSHHTHMKLMEVSPHSHEAHGGLTTLT